MSLPGARTVWEEGNEPGHEMVALGVALALTAAALDLVLTTHLGVLFDVGYLALCVGLALAVRPRDFFSVGVLPPLLMLSTFVLLAASRSEAIARRDDGLLAAVTAGLAHHWVALLLGHLLCLAVLFVRARVLALREASPLVVPVRGDRPVEVTRSGPGPRLHA